MIFGKKDSGNSAELEEKNKILREALEFYADQASWEGGVKYTDADDATIFTDGTESAVSVDKGSRAFMALKKAEKL
jgi:hypothetical protein